MNKPIPKDHATKRLCQRRKKSTRKDARFRAPFLDAPFSHFFFELGKWGPVDEIHDNHTLGDQAVNRTGDHDRGDIGAAIGSVRDSGSDFFHRLGFGTEV